MSDVFCPRQISFLLPGNPAVRITATENGSGGLLFTADVVDTTTSTGDLRALFFDLNPAKLGGLTVSNGGPLLTEWRVSSNNVLDLGDGATLAGKVKAKFDVGIEWGTAGGKKDDINFEVGFTLTNAAGNLTLDDLSGLRFGAKLDSIGGPGGVRNATSKLLLDKIPAAPDAVADIVQIYEDGAAGLGSPSKVPQGVNLFLLVNDTDADTPHSELRITAVHAADEPGGPLHGTVTIAADGLSVIYTPDADYSGTDSFLYCISDGKGGQDNALATVNIVAVADDPLISFTVAQGAHINETLVTVTATQNDADGSEYLYDLDWLVGGGGAPAGVTITPGSVVPGGQPGQIIQMFTVTTDPEMDWNFDIDFTATSVEMSNGDQEDGTGTQNIEIDYTNNFETLEYIVADQSIWSTGDEFKFAYDEFLGVNESFGSSYYIEALGISTGTGYDIGGSIKAGFDVDVLFEGGQIDATIPIDATINTTYNKTTDTIYIDSILALGTGGSFVTTGPEGHFNLDFIFEANFHALVEILFFDVINESFSENLSQPIFNFSSSDPQQLYNPFPFVEIGLEWPHLAVTNNPGTLSGSNASNNFLEVTLDVDALAATFIPFLALLDADPTDPNNFELLDFDITGGLNLLQQIQIGLGSTNASLVLEDGFVIALTWGTPITITNASSHELPDDGDDIISFTLQLTPNVTLTNDTDLGLNLGGQLTVLKNFELGPIVNQPFTLASTSIDIFNDTFELTGVGSQSIDFFA
ncbi:MAG: Ig-like domain-containing protein [Sphingomicrobium sp.]